MSVAGKSNHLRPIYPSLANEAYYSLTSMYYTRLELARKYAGRKAIETKNKHKKKHKAVTPIPSHPFFFFCFARLRLQIAALKLGLLPPHHHRCSGAVLSNFLSLQLRFTRTTSATGTAKIVNIQVVVHAEGIRVASLKCFLGSGSGSADLWWIVKSVLDVDALDDMASARCRRWIYRLCGRGGGSGISVRRGVRSRYSWILFRVSLESEARVFLLGGM